MALEPHQPLATTQPDKQTYITKSFRYIRDKSESHALSDFKCKRVRI